MKKIIFNGENGGLCIIVPTEDALKTLTIEQIALKDVPTGLSFKIVSDADLPADHSTRKYWEINDSELTDGVGA